AEVLPAALLGKVEQTLQRRLGDHDKVDALGDVQRRAGDRVEEVLAAGPWLGALRPEHESADLKRVLARREQLREFHASGPAARPLALEDIVLGDFAAFRQ